MGKRKGGGGEEEKMRHLFKMIAFDEQLRRFFIAKRQLHTTDFLVRLLRISFVMDQANCVECLDNIFNEFVSSYT